jgi:hypothetical protein
MISENAKRTIKSALKPFVENGIIPPEAWKDLQIYLSDDSQKPKRPELLTRKDLKTIFKVSIRTLENWEQAGELKPIKMPGKRLVRYRLEDIEEIVANFGSEEI